MTPFLEDIVKVEDQIADGITQAQIGKDLMNVH